MQVCKCVRGVLLGIVLTRCVPCPDIANIGAIMTTLCQGWGYQWPGWHWCVLPLVCCRGRGRWRGGGHISCSGSEAPHPGQHGLALTSVPITSVPITSVPITSVPITTSAASRGQVSTLATDAGVRSQPAALVELVSSEKTKYQKVSTKVST